MNYAVSVMLSLDRIATNLINNLNKYIIWLLLIRPMIKNIVNISRICEPFSSKRSNF